MKWALLVLCVSACGVDETAPISSKVTLDGDTWTASALLFDKLSPAAVRVTLARGDVDPDGCGWTVFDEVELSLLVGDRTSPHELETLDVTTPLSGGVVYTDRDQNYHQATSGVVVPGRTEWAYSAEEGHNVIVQLDGELDVVLDTGAHLTGAFSARSACN